MQDECITNGLCGLSILCARKFKSARVLFPSLPVCSQWSHFIGASAAIVHFLATHGTSRDTSRSVYRNSPKTDYFSGGYHHRPIRSVADGACVRQRFIAGHTRSLPRTASQGWTWPTKHHCCKTWWFCWLLRKIEKDWNMAHIATLLLYVTWYLKWSLPFCCQRGGSEWCAGHVTGVSITTAVVHPDGLTTKILYIACISGPDPNDWDFSVAKWFALTLVAKQNTQLDDEKGKYVFPSDAGFPLKRSLQPIQWSVELEFQAMFQTALNTLGSKWLSSTKFQL